MAADRRAGPTAHRRTARARGRDALLAVAILAAPLVLASPSRTDAAPAVVLRASSSEEYLALGMPLSAMRAFLALPAAERGRSPLLPDLVARLSGAGHDAEALSLLAKVQPDLTGPARARAYLAEGKIHWNRREFVKAAAAFREAARTPGAAPDAALFLARIQASEGNVPGALRTLAAAPAGKRRAVVAAVIDRIRKRPDVSALRAAAGGAPPGTPAHAAANAALARALLEAGDRRGALAAAREGIAAIARRRDAALRLAAWDGSRTGADDAWASTIALFPEGADVGAFFPAGRAFLAAADLADAARAAGNGAREIGRRAEWSRRALAGAGESFDEKARRAGEIGTLFRSREVFAGNVRNRARDAATALPLSAWGAKEDPAGASLLRRLDDAVAELDAGLDRTRAAVDAAAREEGSRGFPSEAWRMLLFAQRKASIADEKVRALRRRAAFLGVRIRNRWKAKYAERLSVVLDGAGRARRAAREGAESASKALSSILSTRGELERWEEAAKRYSDRLAADAAAARILSENAHGEAERALGEARRELAEAVAREERSSSYLAARAATEILIADKGEERALSPDARTALLAEARGHWEASLPPAGETSGTADEATYALAELGIEEADARFYGRSGAGEAHPDYTGPAALFRAVIDDSPESPYAEPAHYGLALCLQEMGAADRSAAVLAAMLERYPGTRYADEIHLRLGEHEFDRGEFRLAEREYRKVAPGASPDIRATALFKLGWTLFLTERPRESVDPFLSALVVATGAETAGISGEALKMTARALVDAGMEDRAEALLAARGAEEKGPALLLGVQGVLDAQNRYEEAARVADRLGSSYPLAGGRIEAEVAAAEALRKAGRVDDSFARRGSFHALFGPGSRWQAAPGRAPGDIARADMIAEEGLRSAAFHFHVRSRGGSTETDRKAPPPREAVLALYDAHIALFPASPKAEAVAYQRAWLLFEAGRKTEAGTAFEAVARRTDGGRGESSRYMAVQCAKDSATLADGEPPERAEHALGEVIRLCDEYERAFPRGERLSYILLDRARARFKARRFAEAAADAERAAPLLSAEAGRREALHLSGAARFETEEYEGAEKAYRAYLAASPPPGERKDAEKWVGFSMFRRAERLPAGRAAEAAEIFSALAREFPSIDIAPAARYRAAASRAEAGNAKGAIADFLAVESVRTDPALARDATRWLATLYEKTGDRAAAAARYERLAASEQAGDEKGRLHLRAADLFAGIDEPAARRNLLAAAGLADSPPAVRVACYFRAAESARAEGKYEEAEGLYEKATAEHLAAPSAAPGIAGRAYFARAESRFARYRSLPIAPPLEKTFARKRAALDAAGALYAEAIRIGDAETVPASLHRLGEGLEDFRGAILASPSPRGLSEREREEYVFLLEEKAAPIEEKAVDAYRRNVLNAVAADVSSPWVDRSLARLKALRPALFVRKWEYAFPVVPVPDFLGIIVREGP